MNTIPFFSSLEGDLALIPADLARQMNRKAIKADSLHSLAEDSLTFSTFFERLSLLAKLELPCTIRFSNPNVIIPHAVIREVQWAGENFQISGTDFNLRLLGENIHSIRLTNLDAGRNDASRLDILHSQGQIYASIQPSAEGLGGGVWRDVMENPTLAFA